MSPCAEHAEEFASDLEIVRVNDAFLDGECRRRLPGDAVSAAGTNGVQNSGERPKDRYGKDVAVSHFEFAVASHLSPITADAVELVRAAQQPLRSLVVEV